MLRYLAVAV